MLWRYLLELDFCFNVAYFWWSLRIRLYIHIIILKMMNTWSNTSSIEKWNVTNKQSVIMWLRLLERWWMWKMHCLPTGYLLCGRNYDWSRRKGTQMKDCLLLLSICIKLVDNVNEQVGYFFEVERLIVSNLCKLNDKGLLFYTHLFFHSSIQDDMV